MALTRPSKLISSDISGSFNKSAVSASFAQSSAVTASLRSHVLTSALSGSTTIISGSVKSTGSFGSIYTDKNVNASAFVGDGSSLTGIDIPTAADISGSIVGGVSGSSVSTGSFGRVEVAGDLSVTGAHPGWVKIAQNTPSSAATTAFESGIDSTYDVYMIVATNIHSEEDSDDLYGLVGTGGTPTYADSAGDYQRIQFYATTGELSTGGNDNTDKLTFGIVDLGNDDDEALNVVIYMYSPADTTSYTTFYSTPAGQNESGNLRMGFNWGQYDASTAVTALKLFFSKGDIASGTFTLYGLQK